MRRNRDGRTALMTVTLPMEGTPVASDTPVARDTPPPRRVVAVCRKKGPRAARSSTRSSGKRRSRGERAPQRLSLDRELCFAESVAIKSRAASLSGILGVERDVAARLVPESAWTARQPRQCRICSGAFTPAAPHQMRCDPCRVRRLLHQKEG